MAEPAGEGLLAASRRELALYDELLGAYRELAAALGDPDAPVAPEVVAAHGARADTVTAGLRRLAAELGPHRLSGAAVAPETHAAWRASAARAAEAARLNAQVTELARARQQALGARLARLDAGRQGLAGYRPRSVARSGVLA
jgi:hypothetical protein